jgi:hypothetical protein
LVGPASVDALTGHFHCFFSRARFPRSRFVPPRQNSGAGLFACAGFAFARPGLSAKTAKGLRRTVQFSVHGANIRNRLRICKKNLQLFLPSKCPVD